MHSEEEMLRAVACYTKDNDIRMQSTSGGVFTELSRKVLKKNGVVFGAKFDDEYNVVHSFTESIEGLQAFRGSKYPQSKMGEAFIKVKEFLEDNRLVLFSGTACQIEGLHSYLNKDYDNLICIDFICFGVASPKVWNTYLESFFGIKNVREIKFKDKKHGWKSWDFMVRGKTRTIRERGNHSIFMNGYLNALYLRPSCYECCFKGMNNRRSDITISDCWGIDVIDAEFYNSKGVSGIYIHTRKGNSLFNAIQENVVYKDMKPESLLKYNPYAMKNISKSINREEFFNSLCNEAVNKKKLLKKYYTMRGIKNSIRRKIVIPMKNILYCLKNRKAGE